MFWQAMRLDDKMRHVHDNYMELLMANQAITKDLENAIPLDLSKSYPDAVIFEGKKEELSFITQTPKGIKRVRYYVGLPNKDGMGESMIGRVVNSSGSNSNNSKDSSIEYLLREEASLGDWLNETTTNTMTQVIATGLKKGSFNCQYAPWVKNLNTVGSKDIEYADEWNEKSLPMSVSCNFTLFDSKNPNQGLTFKRDIFLAPVDSYYNEQ